MAKSSKNQLRILFAPAFKLLLSLSPFHNSSPFLDLGVVMESLGFSKVYDELDEEAKLRYRQKLVRIGKDVFDPYLPVESFLAQDGYPLVDYPDIYNFLIDAPSPHTKE